MGERISCSKPTAAPAPHCRERLADALSSSRRARARSGTPTGGRTLLSRIDDRRPLPRGDRCLPRVDSCRTTARNTRRGSARGLRSTCTTRECVRLDVPAQSGQLRHECSVGRQARRELLEGQPRPTRRDEDRLDHVGRRRSIDDNLLRRAGPGRGDRCRTRLHPRSRRQQRGCVRGRSSRSPRPACSTEAAPHGPFGAVAVGPGVEVEQVGLAISWMLSRVVLVDLGDPVDQRDLGRRAFRRTAEVRGVAGSVIRASR